MTKNCKERVPDHTDFLFCNKPIFKAGYCKYHWFIKVDQIIQTQKKLLKEMEKLWTSLEDLKSS